MSSNVSGGVPVTSYFPITVGEPPKYVSDKFELYRKELLWWRDIHNEVSDQQLIAMIAIRSDGIIKSILIQFMEATREDRDGRTFPNLIKRLDEELAKTSHENAMAKIGLWSSFQRKSGESFRVHWVNWDKLQVPLIKSDIIFPEAAKYHRALNSLRLVQPNLGILLGTMESQQNGTSIKELRRLSIKLFENRPIDESEDILHTQNDSEASEGDTECDGKSSVTVESFMGADGQVYELGKARPLKIRNKKGQGGSAARSSRSTWNWNNKGGKGSDTLSNESLTTSSQKISCIRCGSDGHHWKRCHLPFQKNVAFPNINGTYNSRPEKTMVSVSDDMINDVSDAGAMPKLENSALPSERRWSAPAEGRTEECQEEERLTETQWVARWNGMGNNLALMCEEESVYLAKPGEPIIIIDSGATNTVVGTRRLEKVFTDGQKPPLQKSSRSFTFGDSRRFNSLGIVDVRVLLQVSTEGETNSVVHGVITADVVHSNVPMLLSRVALEKMAAQLNFDTNELTIQNKYRIRLKEMENGHLTLPYSRNRGGKSLWK